MRRGTQADLSRELGISRSAVSQAFRKHNIQISIDGKFDLDYAAWLLREKQNFAKSKSQRKAKKQLPGLKNPRVKREIVRMLWPVWDEAFRTVIRDRAADGLDDEAWADMETYLLAFELLWGAFHKICDRQYPADLGDFQYKKPDSIDFDFMAIPPRDQIQIILQPDVDDSPKKPTKIDYSKMSLEELERLVIDSSKDLERLVAGEDDNLEDLAFDPEGDHDLPEDLAFDSEINNEK